MSTHTANSLKHDESHKSAMLGLNEFLSYNAHWLLRFALAGVFIFHGVSKLMDVSMFANMMSFPYTIALLVALAETVGGTLIIAGALTRGWITRLGGLMIIPVMLGAIVMVHWGQWNFVPSETHPMGGMEFQVTLLLICLYFVFSGNKQNKSNKSK